MNKEKIELIYFKYEEFCSTRSEALIKKTLNGAGPAGKGEWVRDTLFYKYCVTDAANMHDFLYSTYAPKEITRKDADDFFLYLMLVKLEAQSKVSVTLNKPIVYSYYLAVRLFGWSFWSKNKKS
jgi:hypothetical protein